MAAIHCNNLEVYRFVNKPIPSNTYILVNNVNEECVIIDPGSKDSSVYIDFINTNRLKPTYILLTHEHFDHTWAVNDLKKIYTDVLIVCSKICSDKIAIPQNYFNMLYYNDSEYLCINNVDITFASNEFLIKWNNHLIKLFSTPGHSSSSICIDIHDMLFTGDTIMNGYKPLILKRHEGSKLDFLNTVKFVFNNFSLSTCVYPGHGEKFQLKDVSEFYKNYIETL